MAESIEQLMHANLLQVFGERDPAARRAAIARTYTEDVVFSDAEARVQGHDALDAKVQAILDDAPGFVFTADGSVHLMQDADYLAWALGPEGSDPVVRGADVGIVRDGLLAQVYTVILT